MERKVLVFSHNYLSKDWRTIVGEQLGLLRRTGLYGKASQIHFGVYSEDFDSLTEFQSMVRAVDTESKSKIDFHQTNDNERPTLMRLQEVCRENPGADVLYYHTKGVSSDPFSDPEKHRTVTSWRHAMEYFCIEKWPRCIDLLRTHDCVGILYANWKNAYFEMVYFSGNFWWATSDHVNRTPPMSERDNWMGCEGLITSVPHVFCNLYHPTIKPQGFFFDPQDYRKV